MINISETSKYIENYLTVCIARSIDYALTNCTDGISGCIGQHWFVEFSNHERNNKNPIITNPHTLSIYDLDFQGILKILCFRLPIRMDVLSFYYPESNVTSTYGDKTAFHDLLHRLISRYRNEIAAHQKASNIEASIKGLDDTSIYGYNEAILDMLKLGQIFSFTVDDNGISYYSMMEQLYADYQKNSAYQNYSIAQTIEYEKLNIDQGNFSFICNSIGVDILTYNNEICFRTNDYSSTIARIKDKILIHNNQHPAIQPEEKNNLKYIIPIICCLLIIIIGLFVWNAKDSNKNSRSSESENQIDTLDNTTINTDDSNIEHSTAVDTTVANTSDTDTTTLSNTDTNHGNENRINGSTSFQGLTFSINQDFDGSYVSIDYSNGQNSFALGWVSQAQVTAKTDKGDYTTLVKDNTYKILPNTSGSIPLYFDNLEGNIQSISISPVHLLNSSGLPSNHAGDSVTITITYGATEADTPNATIDNFTEPTINGSCSFQGLTFSIEQTFDGSYVNLTYTNSSNSFTLGWVSQAQVTAQTDVGSYTTLVKNSTFKILPNTSGSIPLYFDNLEGNIQSISITPVHLLNSNGLPSNPAGDSVSMEITYTK